ncbi:MAG: glutamate-5-semialdehyde dehydrogenase [Clostridia bacterium]|nr:glutamate-5-semialdehyde dehydrogenase [Clostridia bacterium]
MVKDICFAAKQAANAFMNVSAAQKNGILEGIKQQILSNVSSIIKHNAVDIALAQGAGRNAAFIDRLTLNDKRIRAMCDGLDAVVALEDAVGKAEEEYLLPSGLNVKKVRSPLGVIGIIYEARPNVTVDAAALCIKSSNGVILRGSKDALNSNRYLVSLMKKVLAEQGFDAALVGFIDGADRALTQEMLSQEGLIDVVIPRGGEELKKFVLQHAAMPVIASSGGNCHAYVEKTADFDMATKIVVNAKIQRPSVCNALETLLCDKDIAAEFLPNCLAELHSLGVEIRGTEEVKSVYPATKVIGAEEFYTEYNDMIIKTAIVGGIDEAIRHINTYSTNHSEAIITRDERKAN